MNPAPSASATTALPPLVDMQSLVPDLAVDMRYFGSANFVGRRIDGYEAPKCLLLPDVAAALARVEQALRARSLRLTIFDCYRPQRAVAHFMRWARDLDDQASKAIHYPQLDKSALVPEYIAERSGHSRADTVDLALLRCADASRVSTCTPMDFGTPFDFFDPRANTASPRVSEAARENRERLLAAMSAEGFRNYAGEWWHFTRNDPARPPPPRDEPVR